MFPVIMHGWTRLGRQLDEYFAGTRSEFDLPLDPRGSQFELRVWQALRQIPYGETTSYVAVARAIGSPTSSRAIGRANGHNKMAIVIPCHRVIRSDGALCGYGGGLWRKEWLIAHEREHRPARESSPDRAPVDRRFATG